MTIGVACYGQNAVTAAMTAVLGAELAGRGAVGGFAVLAILDGDGRFHHVGVQRGGVSELPIPAAWHSAERAALISSGPDRPEPLVQFLPGQSAIGLVSGHRLPNSLDRCGVPVNEAVLHRLMRGAEAQAAIDAVLAEEPEIDAGLIALSAGGGLGWANSARVARRPDLGQASRREADRGYALLHNSIYSNHPSCMVLAGVLGELAWHVLSGDMQAHGILRLEQPIRLRASERDRIHIDAGGAILAVETANAALLSGQHAFRSIVYGAPEVFCEGKAVGHAATELSARLDQGLASPSARLAERSMIMTRC